MIEFRADIHCHSNCSDGTDDPLEIVRKAKAIFLQGLSITDHDTTAAYTPALFALAQELSIAILPGVEISTVLDNIPVHILGYGYDLNSPSFSKFLLDIRKKRVERNLAILKKLHEKKMPIDEEEFLQLQSKTLGRPQIAQRMVEKGYVPTIQAAFERYLKDGALCYAPGVKYSPQEAIDQIHLAKGKAILAHPHFYRKGSQLNQILACPFDGIECHYARLPKADERPFLKLASERGWIATGGSDYHGTIKNTPLGASWVGEDVFKRLMHP